MRCPNCGKIIEDDSTVCIFCEKLIVDDGEGGKVFSVSEWRRKKMEKRKIDESAKEDELEKKIADRKKQMEEHQKQMGLDKLLESIGTPAEDSYLDELPADEEATKETIRATREELKDLIATLCRDKKKEAREALERERNPD